MLRRGFSLIELSLILATVAVIAAVAIPRYTSAVQHYQLDSAARQIAADIALAKARANFGSTAVTITFNPSNNSYQIVGMPALNGASGWYTVNLAADPYHVTLSSATFGNGATPANGAQLTFDGYGSPATGGSVVISNARSQRTISVDGSSGSISVQ